MSAPPASLKDACHYWAYHADDCQQANHWEEPAEDNIRDNDPVKRLPWNFIMSMEFNFRILHNLIFITACKDTNK